MEKIIGILLVVSAVMTAYYGFFDATKKCLLVNEKFNFLKVGVIFSLLFFYAQIYWLKILY